jgi:oligosaccharide reducing-end xylanase
MHTLLRRSSLIATLLALGCAGAAPATGGAVATAAPAPTPAPTTARPAYQTGVYPDLFVELLGKKPAEVQARLDAVYGRLFLGEDDERVYYPVGADMAYILDVGSGDIRSEGMSYGMMIAVQLDKREVFDRLWTFARTYMRQASGPNKGYFAWHVRAEDDPKGKLGSKISDNPASDGEEWFATALLFAANRWGNGGAVNYQAEAQAILDVMLRKHAQPDRGNVTDMFDAATKLVVFVPERPHSTYTDPSYHLPHFYELWARWGAKKDAAFWCSAAAASRAYLHKAAHPVTGLTPDYSTFDGKPYDAGPSNPGHADFRYDAFRVASNVAVDHLWFARDPWQVEQSNRLLAFFASQGGSYPALYTVDGRPIPAHPHGVGLTGMNAAAALAATDPALRKRFVEELWSASSPSGKWRYYDGLLYFLGMLQVSGNYRVIQPAGGPVAACP